jgi:isoquinoline 1-oxidoreductase alpha subunit
MITAMNTLNINGEPIAVAADASTPVLWVLRDNLGLTGTKFGCGIAVCGACTVMVDGQAVRSCVLPVGSMAGKRIRTIEGVSASRAGRAVQAAWIALDVAQCGYCQSGQILSATGLLEQTPRPSDAQIVEAMTGNICRCGTYQRIRAAIHRAAESLA